jgi:hypothetical protein
MCGAARATVLCASTLVGGCVALSPQLGPTDFAALEQAADREEREQLYAQNAIYKHSLPQGTRYTKGTSRSAERRSWQSLDAILRSDRNASNALPTKQMRRARIFTALTITSLLVAVAGTAASAREGLDFSEMTGTGAILLGGGIATVGFAISAGIFYGKTKQGYERAVDIYNDSLGMRLGLYTPEGKYIPPRGALVDKDGYILLEEPEAAIVDEPAPEEAGPTLPEASEPAPAEVSPPAEPVEPIEPIEPVEAAEPAEPVPEAPEPVPVQRPGGAVPEIPNPGSGVALRGAAISLTPRGPAVP